MTTYPLGRRAPHPESTHPRLKLGAFLKPEALPPTPPVVDWVSKVADWPMYGNDEWGDCVWAMIGHAVEAFTTYGQGATVEVTDADVLKGYSAVTGFDPNAGPPGDNPTDQGTVIQDALNYWRTKGVGGHRILAFAQVDHTNPAEVDAALNLFGHLMIGVNFPASAMTQFNNGVPWDVVLGDDGGIEGGHAVSLAYDAGTKQMKVITWARAQQMTAAWAKKYVEEAWVVVAPEWLTAAGANPEGIDLAALSDAYAQLTGQPFPVAPQPQPQPTPPPVPPGPAPGPDPADVALARAVTGWARQRHVGTTKHIAQAFLAWEQAKHF